MDLGRCQSVSSEHDEPSRCLELPCQVRPVGQRDGGVTMPTGVTEAEMDKLLAALKDNWHGRGAPFAPRGMTVF
jgi:hypothetical protein